MQQSKLQNFTRVMLLLVIVIPFVWIFAPFFTPILIAAFCALGLEPILSKIATRTKRNKYVAFGLIFSLVFFVIVPCAFFVSRLVDALGDLSAEALQSSHFIQSLFGLWAQIQSFESQVRETLGIKSALIPSKDKMLATVNPFILDRTKAFLSALPDLGVALFVFFSVLVLLTTRAGKIKKLFVGSRILPEDEIDHITQLLKNSCYFILVSTLVIGAIQAAIVSVGSLIFGYNEFFLIFVVTFLLSFIPVIGAAPVAGMLAVISFINGNTGDGIGMVVIAIVAGSIDNILKPFIMSGESKNLHALISLFGIVGAIIVFGLPGLLLGPLILQIGVELGPLLVQKLVKSNAE